MMEVDRVCRWLPILESIDLMVWQAAVASQDVLSRDW
jgi:hypothetical protein